MEKQILELRAIETNDNTLKITAKVNDYTLSKTLQDKYGRPFKEICPKATWEDALNGDIKIFINHKDYYNVGKSYNIDVTDRGVFLEVELAPLKEKGIYDNVKRGILNQVSFGFNVIADSWNRFNDYFIRRLNKINLLEISLLDCTAAYNNTIIEARSMVEVPQNQLYLTRRKKLEFYKLI